MSNPIDEQTSKTQNLDNLQDKTAYQPDISTAQINQDLPNSASSDVSLHELQEKNATNFVNSVADTHYEEPQANIATDDLNKASAPLDIQSFGEDVSLPQDLTSHDFDNAHFLKDEIINEMAPNHENTSSSNVSYDVNSTAVPKELIKNTVVAADPQIINNTPQSYPQNMTNQDALEQNVEQSLPEYEKEQEELREDFENNAEIASIPVDEEPELPPELLQRYEQIAQDTERPLYFAPGESLKGRPGDEALKQKKRQLLQEYNEQRALDENQINQGANASSGSNYYQNINKSAQDPNAFLQENSLSSQSSLRNEAPRSINVGHADKSIFANVGLKDANNYPPMDNLAPQVRATNSNTAIYNQRIQEPLTAQALQILDQKTAQNLNTQNISSPKNEPHDLPPQAQGKIEPNKESLANSKKESGSLHKQNAIKGASTAFLYIRQLLASIFTHSNLGVLMPETASKLGPCYPSSMPIPMFIIGFLAVAPFFWGANYIMEVPPFLSAALSTAALFILGGACGFLGITKCVAAFSSTRSDPTLHTLIVVLYTVLLTASLETLLDEMSAGLEVALCFGAASMLAALSACSLEIGQTSDPVDSFGMLTIKGLVFATVLTLAVVFYVFPLLVAITLTGLALLMRLMLGLYLQRKGIMISRSIVCGMHLSVLIILLIYIIIAAGRMLI